MSPRRHGVRASTGSQYSDEELASASSIQEFDELASFRSSNVGLKPHELDEARSSTTSLRPGEQQEYAESNDYEQPADQIDSSSIRSASRASRSSRGSHGKSLTAAADVCC